jgi:protein-tyrosine phosphatase
MNEEETRQDQEFEQNASLVMDEAHDATAGRQRVWVGSEDAGAHLQPLVRRGIRHVLVPAVTSCEVARHRGRVHYLQLRVPDVSEFPLLPLLPAACRWIDAALQRAGPTPDRGVLVHCAAGKSRSVAVAVAYVMYRRRQTLRCAYAHVRAARPIVACKFARQLRVWELLLFPPPDLPSALRHLMASSSSSSFSFSTRRRSTDTTDSATDDYRAEGQEFHEPPESYALFPPEVRRAFPPSRLSAVPLIDTMAESATTSAST